MAKDYFTFGDEELALVEEPTAAQAGAAAQTAVLEPSAEPLEDGAGRLAGDGGASPYGEPSPRPGRPSRLRGAHAAAGLALLVAVVILVKVGLGALGGGAAPGAAPAEVPARPAPRAQVVVPPPRARVEPHRGARERGAERDRAQRQRRGTRRRAKRRRHSREGRSHRSAPAPDPAPPVEEAASTYVPPAPPVSEAPSAPEPSPPASSPVPPQIRDGASSPEFGM